MVDIDVEDIKRWKADKSINHLLHIKKSKNKLIKPAGLGGSCRPNLDEDYNYKHYYDLDKDNNYVIR